MAARQSSGRVAANPQARTNDMAAPQSPFGDITSIANATGAESGAPAAGSGAECPRHATEAFWYIGLAAAIDTCTLQPWLWNQTRGKWHKVGETIDLTGDDIVQVYCNGEAGRTFMQVTAASTYPVTRDVQFLAKGA